MAMENDTHTLVKLKRKLNTCDSEDFTITVSFLTEKIKNKKLCKFDYWTQDDTIRVIWAYHKDDAVSSANIVRHQTRGVKSVLLLSNNELLKTKPISSDATSMDLIVENVSNISTSVIPVWE